MSVGPPKIGRVEKGVETSVYITEFAAIRILGVFKQVYTTGTGPIIRNRLLHIGFLIFRVSWIYPQAFSVRPSLGDANEWYLRQNDVIVSYFRSFLLSVRYSYIDKNIRRSHN